MMTYFRKPSKLRPTMPKLLVFHRTVGLLAKKVDWIFSIAYIMKRNHNILIWPSQIFRLTLQTFLNKVSPDISKQLFTDDFLKNYLIVLSNTFDPNFSGVWDFSTTYPSTLMYESLLLGSSYMKDIGSKFPEQN